VTRRGSPRPRPSPPRRTAAAIGTAVFLVVAPGVVAGLGPWLVTGYELEEPLPFWLPFRIAGGILVAGGLLALIASFVRFVVEGIGTPAPIAPTESLVVGGLYRYVRNPMYVAVGAVIVGQALLLGQLGLLLYGGAFIAAVASFVSLYEEPALEGRFGSQYDAYRRAVPAWWPRRRPWDPEN
jgi:protein-S-isoprenylcysteine O-methyltransferase Ste14